MLVASLRHCYSLNGPFNNRISPNLSSYLLATLRLLSTPHTLVELIRIINYNHQTTQIAERRITRAHRGSDNIPSETVVRY